MLEFLIFIYLMFGTGLSSSLWGKEKNVGMYLLCVLVWPCVVGYTLGEWIQAQDGGE